MKILIIARGYPTKNFVMNGIFEFDQAKALARAGHEVIYAAIDMRSIRRWRKWGYESFVKDEVYIEAINVPCGRIPRNLLIKMSELSFKYLYKRLLKRYGQPDIVHAHFLYGGYITIRVLGKSEIPLVLTEHSAIVNKEVIPNSTLRYGMRTYPHFDRIIAVSKSLSRVLWKNFGAHSIVVPNIVDTDNFEFESVSKKTKYYDFISTGRLTDNKGMDILINAFTGTFYSENTVRLFIYGDGPERKNLKTLIADNKMNERIFLMGKVDRSVIAEKMKTSQCFVLASYEETFGLAYIEALAMGLPVIATKCGGPEDFVNESNGILISTNSITELSKALTEIRENHLNYDPRKISREIKQTFSGEIIAERLNDIYHEILREIR